MLCPNCGNLRSVCSDPDTDWYPQRLWCGATATRDMVTRRWHDKHREAKPDSLGFLPTDGAMFWASTEDLTPDDEFL